MQCKICSSEKVKIIYDGIIRNGGLGKYTEKNIQMYQCENCEVIWHENQFSDVCQYYESKEYRNSLEGGTEAERFYELHDKETLAKLTYTGTDIFRNKIIADIGCGCGAFLDFLKGVAQTIIAIEPSENYRKIMDEKKFETYAYASEAKKEYAGIIEVITSFDVIEHVEEPVKFIQDIYELLAEGGEAIIGTPTDAPVMRQILGEIYEKRLLFSTQHLWIFAEKNLQIVAQKAGFQQISIKYYQRYGLNNFIGWIKEEKACGEPDYSFVTSTMNEMWKTELSSKGLSDYIVLYLKK